MEEKYVATETSDKEKISVKNGKLRSAAKDAAYISVCVALITVCSWLSIPTTVPFTLQTFAIFFTTFVLREKKAAFAILAYLLLGLIGVPVFSSFKAGAAAIFGTTGGYMAGFFFIPLSSYIFRKIFKGNKHAVLAGAYLGMIVCYAFGTAWFMVLYTKNVGEIGLSVALLKCVVPFILPDLIKLVLAAAIAPAFRKIVR